MPRRLPRQALPILLLLGALLAACGAAPEAQTLAPEPAPRAAAVWAAPAMARIGLTEAPGTERRVELFAARGEFEAFQVAVRAPSGGLQEVSLSVSELRGPGAARIGAEHVTLYRQHYVEVRNGSPDPGGDNRPLGPGWYADALIPFVPPAHQGPAPGGTWRAVPAEVAAGQNQPFWVDLFVPRDAAPGVYSGSYSLTSSAGAVSGEIQLTVWDFELPLRPSLLSSFDLEEADSLGNLKELLRHRLMPKEVREEHQAELRDEWGLATVDVRGHWSGANRKTCAMEPPPNQREFAEAVEDYAEGLLVYNLTADEIDRCPGLDADMAAWSAVLRQSGVANLVTMMPTTPLLRGGPDGDSLVDIWVVLPKRYVESPWLAEEARRRGTQVWSYNAGVQDDYSPKWQIDFAPINWRIQPGFLSQSMGFTGLLYWRIDLWTERPWQDVQTYFNGRDYLPGDGMIVYPGEAAGVNGFVPSIRLKWLREGVEDYEYVALLKAAGRGDWAMEVARGVAADWSHWTKDPAALERARQTLGEALDGSS